MGDSVIVHRMPRKITREAVEETLSAMGVSAKFEVVPRKGSVAPYCQFHFTHQEDVEKFLDACKNAPIAGKKYCKRDIVVKTWN